MSKIEKRLLKQIRLDTVPEGWEIAQVGLSCKIRNDLRKPISVEERSIIKGSYPYYGPTGILDYINEYALDGEFALIGEDGDHFLKPSEKSQTIYVKGKFNVNNHAHVIASSSVCRAEWFAIFFKHRNITNYLSRQGANRYKLNKDTLEKMPILIPSYAEQKAIADLLATWDEAIEKTDRLIKAQERFYQSQISTWLSKDIHERIRLKKFLKEVSKRNGELSIMRVLSVTNSRGFVLPEEQFERQVASDNLSNYKIVSSGEYAYNPSRVNVGSIARLDNWDSGVLSPMYTVFKINKPDELNSDLFLHWLNSYEAKQRIKLSAQGSVRETVSFDDFCSIEFPKIEPTKQKKLADYFNSIISEIDQLKELSEKYKRQKRGLMQKLLTGTWHIKPEIIEKYTAEA